MYPSVRTPTYATKGAACFDISAYFHGGYDTVSITNSEIIETGLQVEVPEGYVMLIFSRSGHGFKDDVRLANCVGVIDSDYRGEIKVKLTNDSTKKNFIVTHGDRIAQAMIVPAFQYPLEEVMVLSATERGKSGFGSTGA